MKHSLALFLGLAGVSGLACKAHEHGLAPNSEVVTLELKSGLK